MNECKKNDLVDNKEVEDLYEEADRINEHHQLIVTAVDKVQEH